MTGMKNPVTFLHRFVHSLSYDIVCRIQHESCQNIEFAPIETIGEDG